MQAWCTSKRRNEQTTRMQICNAVQSRRVHIWHSRSSKLETVTMTGTITTILRGSIYIPIRTRSTTIKPFMVDRFSSQPAHTSWPWEEALILPIPGKLKEAQPLLNTSRALKGSRPKRGGTTRRSGISDQQMTKSYSRAASSPCNIIQDWRLSTRWETPKRWLYTKTAHTLDQTPARKVKSYFQLRRREYLELTSTTFSQPVDSPQFSNTLRLCGDQKTSSSWTR